MNDLFFILAQAAEEAPQAEGGNPMNMVLIMFLFIGAMYFFMIAPQKKRQKQHQEMINNLSTGDDVVTIGGIYGRITNKTDKTYILKIADNTKIEILKTAVAQKLDTGNEAVAVEEPKNQ